MAIEYLKKAAKTPETESAAAQKVASDMLADIESRGEAAVREYAAKLDRWTGEIVVTADEIERRTRDIPATVKRDIEFATAQVRRFAHRAARVDPRVRDRDLSRGSSPGSGSSRSTSPAATCRPAATRTSPRPT